MLFGLASTMFAQTFQSEKLKSIATAITLSPSAGDGVIGYSDGGSYKGKPITVCRDRNNVITHIGYYIFDNTLKQEQPTAVYDFIERYLLELSCIPSSFPMEQRLRDDKFLILGGSVGNISKLSTSTSFSMECRDEKYYEVVWSNENTTLLDIAFPIQYELLLGMPKVEIEKKIKDQISGTSIRPYELIPDSDVVEISENVFQSQPVSNYYVESLNTARYYSKDSEGNLSPIFDSTQKWYSAANLFGGLIPNLGGYKLYIEQNNYGFTKESYTVSFQQWIDYCKNNDITVYFAVEEEREDGLKGLLIGQSKKLGFNHMMSVIIPNNFAENPKSVFKASLNAYIPTQNVKELYQKYTKKDKEKK